MPDIAMCDATNCNKSKTCRRHPHSGTWPDGDHQYWLNLQDISNCEYYWEIKKDKKPCSKP